MTNVKSTTSAAAPAQRFGDAPSPPTHVAIIMDGNGRWAKARGLPRSAGHTRGAEAVREAIKGAQALGISYLTLYGFSLENWKRPKTEINDLMSLLRLYLRKEIGELAKAAQSPRTCATFQDPAWDFTASSTNGWTWNCWRRPPSRAPT